MAKITKIALTGAPCSGKTSAVERLAADLYTDSRDVFICPESAYEVIASGAIRENYLAFETLVAKKQLENEAEILKKAEQSDKNEVVIIYDRGITDCFSYVEDKDALAENIGINIVDSWARYDALIVMETAPESEYFSTPARIETYEEALEYQKKLLAVTVGHSHLRFIKNESTFEEKYISCKAEFESVLSGYEIEKKFLVEYPDFASLEKYNPFKAEISQTYLLCAVGSHRIRKRGSNGTFTYFETLKIRVTDSCSEEIESIISEQKYNELMESADPDKNTIIKDRYCFLYEGQYFELDVFRFWDDRAFLELELKSENQEYKLPPEIKVIEDVSDDYHYKNSYLAGLKL